MPNVAPPSGWQLNTYDDTTWGVPVATGLGGPPADPSAQAYLLWPEDPGPDPQEQALFRGHFQMPPGIVILAATLYIDGQCQFMEIYLNNNLFPGFPQTDINFATISVPVGWFILGADNVLAVRSSASGADLTHLTTPSSKYIITYDT